MRLELLHEVGAVQKLRDKVALVTGAAGGIGSEIARQFAREGAKVVVHYGESQDAARRVASEIENVGGEAIVISADMRFKDDIDAMFDQVHEVWGSVDILVNNAAVDPRIDFLEMTEKQWDDVLDTNLKGPFLCAQRAAQGMVAAGKKGRIINISSVHGQLSSALMSPYAAAKGGINMLTRQLAVELAPKKITVNAVAPGVIEIPRYFTQFPDYNPEAYGTKIPCGRVGYPSDVAPIVTFLASDDADFITGQIIVVDGGTTSKLAL